MTKKTANFLDYFNDLDDPRLDRKKFYPIEEILLITFLAVICGAESWNDIENFGKAKLPYLRKYLPFNNGTPSDDTFRRLFRCLASSEFQKRFASWMKTVQLPNERVISVDGKVSRQTFDGDDKAAIHMVSAFASELRLVLAQTSVDSKSNEIKAIPELLEWLDLEGAIVTIDAMGCQKNICKKIKEKQGDYVIALKGNQEALHKDAENLFSDPALLEGFGFDEHINIDGGHGRIEERRCRVITVPSVLLNRHDWPGLQSIIEIESKRELKTKSSFEKRYYISSLPADAKKLGDIIRQHWGIENGLHYILDVSFNDDASRIRKGNAPENMAIIKHTALNLLQKNKKTRESIKGLRKIAAWSDERLDDIFNQIL